MDSGKANGAKLYGHSRKAKSLPALVVLKEVQNVCGGERRQSEEFSKAVLQPSQHEQIVTAVSCRLPPTYNSFHSVTQTQFAKVDVVDLFDHDRSAGVESCSC